MTCTACTGRATLYLCGPCQSKLRELLEHLPQWITHLEEAVIGQVRLGDGGGGRTTARREPFKGDDEALAQCTCGHPETKHDDYYVAHDGNARSVEQGCTAIDRDDEAQTESPCHCREYRPRTNQARMRTQLLAAGRINARAAELLDAVRNSLTTWTRHLGESRGIVFVRPGFIGPLLTGHVRLANTTPAIVAFLAENVGAIACDESAGECLAELKDHVDKIERVINPPLAMRYLGPCRTFDERTRHTCGTQLQCREDVLEVTCPKCRHTYNANHLQSLTENDLEREKMTVEQILGYNRRLPPEYRIDERKLRRWRKPGKDGKVRLKACGYRRSDGREVINRHSEDDEPLYRWADIKALRAERPDRKVSA